MRFSIKATQLNKSAILLGVFLQSVPIYLSIIMLNVIMLSVFKLSVFMMNVVAP
jgi:hypothetical protein